LDGDVHQLRGADGLRYTIYYHCASQFGWDKETVDKQEISYLKKLFAMHTQIMEDSKKNNIPPPMGRGFSKNFK
tara:strand:+ start:80 stop:301 length:222 start_codon:yes stop_codon:yes gene_type:complete